MRRSRSRSGADPVPSERRPTVVHVLPQDLARGAQVYAGQLRDQLAGDDAQVHLLLTLFEGPPGAARPDLALGVRAGRSRSAGLNPRAVVDLRRVLRERRASVVVAHGGEPLKYVVAARPAAPVVYYRIGLATAEISRRSRIMLYRGLVCRVERVVAVSTAIRDQARSQLRVPPGRLVVIPNGRDPEVYFPGRTESASSRSDLPRILFIGAPESGKRPELFLDVVELLRAQGAAFRAAMIGTGPLAGQLAARAGELEVAMMGRRSDVADQLRAADLVLLTSRKDTEGMPGVPIEAGLTGLPVVATDAAGVSDIIQDGVTGYVVTEDSADALAGRVAELLADPQSRAELGARARERCLANFTLAVGARRWHELVAELLEASSGPQRRSR